MLPVTCTSDVLELIKIGQKNRAVGATALNERSSRSHRYAKCWISFKYLYFREHDPLVDSTSHGCVKDVHIYIVGVIDHGYVHLDYELHDDTLMVRFLIHMPIIGMKVLPSTNL